MRELAHDDFTLTTFYTSWKTYQGRLKESLAPLTAGQLALRPGSHLRSVGENALHIVGCRSYWFTTFLGEDGGEGMTEYGRWNEIALMTPVASTSGGQVEPGSASLVPTASELVEGLDRTWHFIADCLDRWGPAGMRQTFPDDWDGTPVDVSRAWVVWHVLEHDLHHGGEVSVILGMHGIRAEFAI
jgi:uncharacterized damage-inducible protein DinB